MFIEKGYRRALMTDVGARLELSHALLYRYVESKEALFELALRYAVDPDSMSGIEVPLPTPPPGQTLEILKGWGRGSASFPVLSGALASPPPTDVAGELAAVVEERYLFMERNRRLLALIESSVLDIPDLYAFYITKGRRRQVRQLADYLESRMASGALRRVSDVDVATRFIVESVAWFAWHRKADPDPSPMDDAQARQTVVELLVAAFAPEGSPS